MAFKNLGKRELRIMKNYGEVLIPLPSERLTKTFDDVGLMDRISIHTSKFSKDTFWALRFALWAMELGAIFFKFSFKFFTSMPRPLQEEYVTSWHKTRWALRRLMSRFVEAVLLSNYYSVPEVTTECGYTPHFVKPKPSLAFPHENMCIAPLDHDVKEVVDVCVVGSGAGGSVIAKELAEAGHRVLIVEEGGYYTVEDFGQDMATMTRMLYRNGGIISTFGWPNILVPVGKCVGGTTTINGGTCIRTPPQIFKRWVDEFGLSNWSYEKILPHFERVEKVLQVGESQPNVRKRNAEVFSRGLIKLGYKPKVIPRNAPDCKGSGVCSFGCPTNAKNSAAIAHIPRALTSGARLYAHCQASKIIHQRGHASKLIARFRDPDTGKRLATLEVEAKVIVVSCGTLHTPVLLKRSGVPNPSGAIGHHLTLHPAAKVMALFDEEIKGWDEVPQSIYMDALASEGIMLEGIFTPPAYAASSCLLHGLSHRSLMEQYNNVAAFGLMISDTTEGRIMTLPKNHALAVYTINRADLPKYVRGIALMAETFFAAGASKVFPSIHTIPELNANEGAKVIYNAKIRNKDLDLQAFHPLGTCRMGADPRYAVCDPFGRVYGLDNVFVADGSIFPTSLGVNPQITIMAVASKVAEYIHREWLGN